MNWCFIIPLLTGLIGSILGYLLGKLGKNNGNQITQIQNELDACRKKSTTLQADLDSAKASLTANTNTSTNVDADLQAKYDAETAKNIALQNELNALKANASNASSGIATSLTGATVANAVIFDADAAKVAFGKKIKENDLTVVEGIGPKIQELFHNHDVKTWAGLAQCSLEKRQEVLDSGGARFKMHNPTTWAEQADLASKGKWAELKKWQDELDGGN